MRPGKQLMLAFALLVALLTGPGFGFCAPPPDTCAAIATLSLSDEQFGKPVLHLTATKVDVAPSLPAYCDVRGTMWPEISFAVKLPIPWNGKFYMVGNGGKAGNIEEGAMANGLKLGYVTASTNTGHDNKREKGAMFGYNPLDNSNPNARQKEIDFGYRSVHETEVIAKKIMQAYYGSLPAHSYWVGCSTGGRQGLIEAQRYPDDFDGIVAGAPVYNYMAVQIYAPWYLRHSWLLKLSYMINSRSWEAPSTQSVMALTGLLMVSSMIHSDAGLILPRISPGVEEMLIARRALRMRR